MAISLRSILLSIASAALLAGCAGAPYSPAPFTPASIDTTAYAAKVDAFVVVMDASSSMKLTTKTAVISTTPRMWLPT